MSPTHPTQELSIPINPTYSRYRIVDVLDINVNLAFAKNEKLTAKIKPAKLDNAWVACIE